MHRLSREVRFSVTPFAAKQPEGFNTYASKPTGEGLSFYLSLWVELEGMIDPETGFIVNVSVIDQVVRSCAVPLFLKHIQASLDAREPLLMGGLIVLLVSCAEPLRLAFENKYGKRLRKLRLEINPFRSISIDCQSLNDLQVKDLQMVTYSEKFEFSAMHKLWSEALSESKNFELFGKCANPAGHGHNYILEVAVQLPAEPGHAQHTVDKELEGWSTRFQQTVKVNFVEIVDHKNLNIDVEAFKTLNPTVENIALVAWKSLAGRFGNAKLSYVTVWENDRTYCTYSEDN